MSAISKKSRCDVPLPAAFSASSDMRRRCSSRQHITTGQLIEKKEARKQAERAVEDENIVLTFLGRYCVQEGKEKQPPTEKILSYPAIIREASSSALVIPMVQHTSSTLPTAMMADGLITPDTSKQTAEVRIVAMRKKASIGTAQRTSMQPDDRSLAPFLHP